MTKRRKPPNLRGFHCGAHHTPQNYQIDLLASGQVLTDLDDTVTFVCKKDTLVWAAAGYNVTVTLNNNGPDLFESGLTSIPSTNGMTVSQTIADQGDHSRRAYKYSIQILDASNKVIATLDPHIIPMGN